MKRSVIIAILLFLLCSAVQVRANDNYPNDTGSDNIFSEGAEEGKIIENLTGSEKKDLVSAYACSGSEESDQNEADTVVYTFISNNGFGEEGITADLQAENQDSQQIQLEPGSVNSKTSMFLIDRTAERREDILEDLIKGIEDYFGKSENHYYFLYKEEDSVLLSDDGHAEPGWDQIDVSGDVSGAVDQYFWKEEGSPDNTVNTVFYNKIDDCLQYLSDMMNTASGSRWKPGSVANLIIITDKKPEEIKSASTKIAEYPGIIVHLVCIQDQENSSGGSGTDLFPKEIRGQKIIISSLDKARESGQKIVEFIDDLKLYKGNISSGMDSFTIQLTAPSGSGNSFDNDELNNVSVLNNGANTGRANTSGQDGQTDPGSFPGKSVQDGQTESGSFSEENGQGSSSVIPKPPVLGSEQQEASESSSTSADSNKPEEKKTGADGDKTADKNNSKITKKPASDGQEDSSLDKTEEKKEPAFSIPLIAGAAACGLLILILLILFFFRKKPDETRVNTLSDSFGNGFGSDRPEGPGQNQSTKQPESWKPSGDRPVFAGPVQYPGTGLKDSQNPPKDLKGANQLGASMQDSEPTEDLSSASAFPMGSVSAFGGAHVEEPKPKGSKAPLVKDPGVKGIKYERGASMDRDWQKTENASSAAPVMFTIPKPLPPTNQIPPTDQPLPSADHMENKNNQIYPRKQKAVPGILPVPLRLEEIEGAFANKDADLTLQQELVIGSDPVQCDIVFSQNDVSPRHARIYRQDDRIYIEDLGSERGTYLDGMRLFSRNVLRNGDEISVGNAGFTIRLL